MVAVYGGRALRGPGRYAYGHGKPHGLSHLQGSQGERTILVSVRSRTFATHWEWQHPVEQFHVTAQILLADDRYVGVAVDPIVSTERTYTGI